MHGRRSRRRPCPGDPLADSWKEQSLSWRMVSLCSYFYSSCFLLLSSVRAPAEQLEEMWEILRWILLGNGTGRSSIETGNVSKDANSKFKWCFYPSSPTQRNNKSRVPLIRRIYFPFLDFNLNSAYRATKFNLIAT